MASIVVALLILVMLPISKRPRICIAKGQIPRLLHEAALKRWGYENIEFLAGHVVATYFTRAVSQRSTWGTRNVRAGTINGHIKEAAWAKQQSLRRSASLRISAYLIQIDLVQKSAWAGFSGTGTGKYQDLVGIGRIGAETCDIEVSVWAKDQTFRPVKRYVVVLNVSLCVTDEHVLKDLLLWIVTQNLALEVSLRWRIWCV